MVDFNNDANEDEGIDHHKLDIFCGTLNLINPVKSDTCYTTNDLFLTNKPCSFQFISVHWS